MNSCCSPLVSCPMISRALSPLCEEEHIFGTYRVFYNLNISQQHIMFLTRDHL